MIPILYEKTETAFRSNGLGRLSDCIRCIATEERNGVYEVEFDYPVTGILFDQITIGRIIACTHDEQGDVQPFDIYAKTEPINGIVTFYAHHISYRLNEIVVKPFEASSCVDALSKIRAYSVGDNPFTFWTNKTANTEFISVKPRQIRNMLGGEENSILDVYGTGEYEFDKFDVNLYLHRGQDTNVSIRYGKNIINFTNDYDASETYTAVVPYWLGEVREEGSEESTSVLVTLPEWYIESGYASAYGREIIVPMDLSTVFTEQPTVEQLRTTAISRLNNSEAWIPNQTVKVNFVQLWQTDEYAEYAVLQRLRLCDTCGVFVPMYGISLRAKVIKVIYNVLLDRYDEMELGDKPTTYTAVLEKVYGSKVAGVVEGLKTVNMDIRTVAQNLADAILSINNDLDDIRNQIDRNITTWFFENDPTMSNPPVAYDPDVEGSGWDTDEKKDAHVGDLYYNKVSGKAWRFVKDNGTYSWNEMSDSGVAEALRIASEAKDTADAKRRIFYATPVPPYDRGDLWTQGDNSSTGDILRCMVSKAEGETYSRADWVKASKYTDDSTFVSWVEGDFLEIVDNIENQIDAKVETWTQASDPATPWNTIALKKAHEGDLWLYTGLSEIRVYSDLIKPQGTYKFHFVESGSLANESSVELADENSNVIETNDAPQWVEYSSTNNNIFDLADGKSTIYYGTTSGTYADKDVGDYLVDSSTGNTYRWTGSAWQKVTDYQTAINDGLLALKGELVAQIDAKIETWAQASNPASSWTTTALRTAHNGDLWLYTGTSSITVGSVTIKPQGVYKYNGSNNTWSAYSSTSSNLFDIVDGKSTIYYGSTSGTYANKEVGDYLVDPSTGSTYRWSGSAWVKVSDYQTAIENAKDTIQDQYEQAIDDATELIRGGTGGYVVTTTNANGQPIEILITDNINLNQARNVWRWNQNGLAHSSTGYNGPFSDFAITKDGKLNASRILTGSLIANLITAGTLSDSAGKNYWNLDSGRFTTKQGAIADYEINQNSLVCETVDQVGTVEHAELTGTKFEIYQKTDDPPITRPAFSGIRLVNNTIGIRYKSSNASSISGVDINPLFGIAFRYTENSSITDLWSSNIPTVGSVKGTKYGLNIQPLGDADDVNVYGNLVVVGDFSVSGGKQRIVKTENYQDRLLFCYETPTPLFGDIGEAVIDNDGFCYIYLDDIFSETIAEQVEYQVFLQKEGEGDCWIADKQTRYFVIQGTPNLKVAWELKAKQKEFYNERLEQFGVKLNEYVHVGEQDSLLDDFIAEQEVILYENN